jgi:hypothetical protein
MLKIWRFAFQRQPVEEKTVSKPVATFYPTAVVIMSVMIIVFSLGAGPIYRYGLDAAEQIFDVGGQSAALSSGVR